jgi:hypothetical protein
MSVIKSRIDKAYWQDLILDKEDIENIANVLFDFGKPVSINLLLKTLINFRLSRERENELIQQESMGQVYLPKETYAENDALVFPALDWLSGKVISVREGKNPEYGSFKVLDVKMTDGSLKQFASELSQHELNNPILENKESNNLNEDEILHENNAILESKLIAELHRNKDIIRVGDKWFPKALLVDFNQGHINIAEALLDMKSGGPLGTSELLNQMDVSLTDDIELNEFSLNYALKKDHRFDEVGTTGTFSWFLRRQEPEPVREIPLLLKYDPMVEQKIELPKAAFTILQTIEDELEINNLSEIHEKLNSTSVTLIYPHWRTGSLPLTSQTRSIFPSAIETERVKIRFIDKDNGQEISGWVVRPFGYVYGLEKWYEEKELIPGSIINVETSPDAGSLYIHVQKRRSNREWMKTVLVGADGGIVIALLKQPVTAGFQEQMAIVVPDVNAMDLIWKARSNKPRTLKSDVLKMVQELSKLNTQQHVHFTELYAAVNLLRRCPPTPIINVLFSEPEFSHVGDQYFHLNESDYKE